MFLKPQLRVEKIKNLIFYIYQKLINLLKIYKYVDFKIYTQCMRKVD